MPRCDIRGGPEGPQDGTGQRSTPKNKKKSQERRSLVQTSRLTIDGKHLDRDLKKGNVFAAAQPLSAHPAEPPVPTANGPSVSSESNSSNLPPIKNVPVRPKEDESCAELSSNVEGSTTDSEDTKEASPLEEDLLPFDLNNSLCDPTHRVREMSLARAEHYTYEMGVGDDGRRAELPHRLVWQHNVAADPAAERSSEGQRQTRDHRKSHTVEENLLEDNHKNEGEKSAYSTRSNESKPGSASASESVGNLNSAEDWSGSSIYGRERQAFENNQRCYAGLISSVRPVVQRSSTFNIPGSLVRPTNQAEASGNVDVAAASVQVMELTGSPRLTARRQLSPLRTRDSFSASESCPSSSPSVSTFEDSSLLEDTLSNGLSSASPGTTSHDEDTLLTSHNSSSSTDSSQPSLFRANFTAHLHMTGTLPDQVPIFLTVSDLRNPSSFVSSASVCGSPSTKERNKPETDPEKLKKLQER
ncbi:UNVERIFIED_CONTAM: hypothetical protein K2H54_009739 [Gekko kuhli]